MLTLRRALLIAVIGALAVASAGCERLGQTESTDTPAAARTCLGDVFYPGLPVEELTRSLPVPGVSEEFIQTEIGVLRGPGDCTDPGHRPLQRDCPVLESRSEDTIGIMLDRTPDELTTGEFAVGATMALSELVSGRAADDSFFQFRMTAWHGGDNTNVLRIVASCNDVVLEQVDGVHRVTVYEGDEPHLIAFESGDDVFLLESIRSIAPDGRRAHVAGTASGLLSFEAMGEIQRWWVAYATDVFARTGSGTET